MNEETSKREPLFDREATAKAEIPDDWGLSNVLSILSEAIENLTLISERLAPLADEHTKWEIEQHTQRNRDPLDYWDRAAKHFADEEAEGGSESEATGRGP